MSEPLEHIARPRLPWQRGAVLTECGLDAAGVAGGVLSIDDAVAKVKRQGQQRFAMTTCMTCVNRARYSMTTWERDPVAVMRRHCDRGRDDDAEVELRAIALLVEAHRDEFDGLVAGLRDASSLDDARARRRRRA